MKRLIQASKYRKYSCRAQLDIRVVGIPYVKGQTDTAKLLSVSTNVCARTGLSIRTFVN